MNNSARRSRVAEILEEQQLDALLVTRMTNIRYLTGFSGTTAYLIMSAKPTIVVDFRYREQVEREVAGIDVHEVVSAREVWPATIKLLGEAGFGRLGLERGSLQLGEYLDLQSIDGLELAPTRDLVEQLRYCKEPEEIDAIRRAVQMTDEVMADLLGILRPGVSEHEIAGEVERLQRAKGGERSASEIIVASGPRTALPHGIASDRVVKGGEPIMFDLGTVVDGYLADLTRTIHLGPASERFREIYGIVGRAQELAEEAIRPGMTARDADGIARDVISAAGYGSCFGHSLGHSIGLDNHESPALSPHDETVLEPGMVLTVEPGIYVAGELGVRTEDVVVVRDDGCEVLTRAPKELIEL